MSFLNNCNLLRSCDDEFKVTIAKVCVYLKNEAYVVDDCDNVYHLIGSRKLKIEILSQKNVIDFQYAYHAESGITNYHMVALTEDGKIFYWGSDYYQTIKPSFTMEIKRFKIATRMFSFPRSLLTELLYRMHETKCVTIGTLWKSLGNCIEPYERFDKIACGSAHFMAVTEKKQIMVWGNNRFGQLGNAELPEEFTKHCWNVFKTALISQCFLMVTLLISLFIVFFTSFSYFANRINNDILPTGMPTDIPMPTVVPNKGATGFTVILVIVMAVLFFLFVSIYWFKGQCCPFWLPAIPQGVKPNTIRITDNFRENDPLRIKYLIPYLLLLAGAISSLKIFSPHLAFGIEYIVSIMVISFIFCVLCLRKTKKMTTIPEDSSNSIKNISCGSFHSLVLFENGNLYGWGSNEHGQLGRILDCAQTNPIFLFDNVEAIATFNSQTLVLFQNGTLKTMGDNTFGQLGNFRQLEYREPIQLNIKFKEITTINGISIGKTVGGQFYAWGLFKFETIRKEEEQIDDDNSDNETEENKNNKKLKNASITKIVKAHIITEPKLVRCKSFNDFISRCSALTYFTVDVKEESILIGNEISRSDENGVTNTAVVIEDNEPLINVNESLINENQTVINESHTLIDEEELTVVEYVFGSSLETTIKQTVNKTSIHIGARNKFAMFDNSIISPGGDITLSDITQQIQNV